MCNHSIKFGGHRHSGSRDVMIFACHVALQDHVIRELCYFIIRGPSSVSHHPTKFRGHRYCGSGDWF